MNTFMAHYRAHIRVTLRPSILDPQGKAVEHAILSLGLDSIRDVRMGKYIELTVEAGSQEEADRQTQEVCRRLLANPVMEDFAFTLERMP